MKNEYKRILVTVIAPAAVFCLSPKEAAAQCAAFNFTFQSNPTTPSVSPNRPVTGDFNRDGNADAVWTNFNGDGLDDISVFRPSEGNWYRLNSSNGQFFGARFGLNGDIPIQ